MSCRSHMQHLLNEVSTVSALRRSKCRAESTDKELSLIGDIWKNGLLPKLFNQIVEWYKDTPPIYGMTNKEFSVVPYTRGRTKVWVDLRWMRRFPPDSLQVWDDGVGVGIC